MMGMDSGLNLILIGAPGAGKGTQAQQLREILNIPHISTGDIFRKNIKEQTELGKKVKEIIDAGGLVPDELTDKIVDDRISEVDCKNGFMLDGYPRNVDQAKHLDATMKSKSKQIDAVLYINVEDKDIIERLTARRTCSVCKTIYNLKNEAFKPPKDGICCGRKIEQRDDDKQETIKKRLDTYHNETEPVIRYYEKSGILEEVKGEGDVEKTTSNVLKAIEKIKEKMKVRTKK